MALQGSTGRTQNIKMSGSSSLKTGITTVSNPGTRVRLPDINCTEVTIIALATNTGTIYAGDSSVSSSSFGATLEPKGSITFPVANANMVYIDSSAAGEGVSYVAV